MLAYKWCICTLAALISASSYTADQIISHTLTVDPSGRGGFRTIQSAIDSVPSNNQRWICIHIKPGIYKEQVKIPRDKPFIYLKGAGKNKTIIVWNAKDDIIASAAFAAEADHLLAKGITFANSYNDDKSTPMARAVAARVQGDKSAFHYCAFISLQDTLWDVKGRHYFKRCTIRGAVDFIFGNGQSIYEGCMISVAYLDRPGYITAQGREISEDKSGFVFKNCRIVGKGKAYLGRPWRRYARVVFYKTQMSEAVVPQGWRAWRKSDDVGQLTMSEVESRGPGAKGGERVKWEKKMSEKEVKKLASLSFIDDEGWLKTAYEVMAASMKY